MAWHHFVLRCDRREAVQAALATHGVRTAIHYPIAPFDQPCYAGQYDRKRYPVAAALAETVLSLPMADYLTEAEVAQVTAALARVPVLQAA